MQKALTVINSRLLFATFSPKFGEKNNIRIGGDCHGLLNNEGRSGMRLHDENGMWLQRRYLPSDRGEVRRMSTHGGILRPESSAPAIRILPLNGKPAPVILRLITRRSSKVSRKSILSRLPRETTKRNNLLRWFVRAASSTGYVPEVCSHHALSVFSQI